MPFGLTMVNAAPLIMQRRNMAGSLIGRICETQEMLDFCAEYGVAADVEVIPIQQINEAYELMVRSDVRYPVLIQLTLWDAKNKGRTLSEVFV